MVLATPVMAQVDWGVSVEKQDKVFAQRG